MKTTSMLRIVTSSASALGKSPFLYYSQKYNLSYKGPIPIFSDYKGILQHLNHYTVDMSLSIEYRHLHSRVYIIYKYRHRKLVQNCMVDLNFCTG